MATPTEIASQFVNFYYQTFDTNRAALTNLYRPNSFMSWEAQEFQGVGSIVEKLNALPPNVVHKVSTTDAQPASEAIASIIVLVTGQLSIDGSPPMQFSQAFHLIPDAGSYYVFNDVFRLNFAES
ncbi:Nuclear transport factor 2 [Tulasnella sp. 419]|nr:Nuclear transport factor 2 [Tulasnella sp. 418]KAG8954072.1 Nuclear transport factor 2 [Tulasnella sp. 419]